MGTSSDALRMETELAKEKQMLDAARRSRDGFAQKLNLTLGRPLDSPWPALETSRHAAAGAARPGRNRPHPACESEESAP